MEDIVWWKIKSKKKSKLRHSCEGTHFIMKEPSAPTTPPNFRTDLESGSGGKMLVVENAEAVVEATPLFETAMTIVTRIKIHPMLLPVGYLGSALLIAFLLLFVWYKALKRGCSIAHLAIRRQLAQRLLDLAVAF